MACRRKNSKRVKRWYHRRVSGGMMMRLLAAATMVVAMTSAIAGQAPTATGKQVITQGPNRNLPFSSAVKAGGFVYVSGTISDQGGDIRAQTKWCLDDLDRTLKAAGSSLQNA